jgi:hypothetical protein
MVSARDLFERPVSVEPDSGVLQELCPVWALTDRYVDRLLRVTIRQGLHGVDK